MKNRIGILTLLCFSAFFLTFCEEEEDLETCQQDEFCTATVTACCTEDACVFQYNGTDYPDTTAGLADLSEAIGCTANADLVPSLQTLAINTKASL